MVERIQPLTAWKILKALGIGVTLAGGGIIARKYQRLWQNLRSDPLDRIGPEGEITRLEIEPDSPEKLLVTVRGREGITATRSMPQARFNELGLGLGQEVEIKPGEAPGYRLVPKE